MKTNTHQLGRQNEALAVRYLKRQGYRILEQNYRTSQGEIDIVARCDRVIVFVEVKSRGTDRYGKAKYAVTRPKQGRISKVALTWLKSHSKLGERARFDVVTVDNAEKEPHIELIKNAFELNYGVF